MLTIRLTRKGKKNHPFFRVVLVDKRRSASGGRAVEVLGYVDTINKRRSLKKERVLYWISKGAQPSPTIHNLLVSEKIIKAKKINKSKSPKKKEGDVVAVVAPAAPVTNTPIEAAPVSETKPELEKPTEEVGKIEKPA